MQKEKAINLWTAAFVCIGLLGVAAIAGLGTLTTNSIDATFLHEFNRAAGPTLYQDTAADVRAIAPGYDFSSKEWAKVWRFADKYDIREFPKYNGDIYSQRRVSLALLEQLQAIDEYIKTNNIDINTALTMLNQAFAAQNGSLVNLFQTMGY